MQATDALSANALGARRSHAPRYPCAAQQGPATVNELAAPFDISLPAISRHLKVLESAGLISPRPRSAMAPVRAGGAVR